MTASRLPFVMGIAALATLIAAPAAYGVCKSPRNICKHIDDCLQRGSEAGNKDADQIKDSPVRAGFSCESTQQYSSGMAL
jgi:hypothetical protein